MPDTAEPIAAVFSAKTHGPYYTEAQFEVMFLHRFAGYIRHLDGASLWREKLVLSSLQSQMHSIYMSLSCAQRRSLPRYGAWWRCCSHLASYADAEHCRREAAKIKPPAEAAAAATAQARIIELDLILHRAAEQLQISQQAVSKMPLVSLFVSRYNGGYLAYKSAKMDRKTGQTCTQRSKRAGTHLGSPT